MGGCGGEGLGGCEGGCGGEGWWVAHAQEMVDSEKQSISTMQLFKYIRSLLLYIH